MSWSLRALAAFTFVTFAYLASYAALRVGHVMVHTKYWTSAEGLDGHYTHDVATERPWVGALFAPLRLSETRFWEQVRSGA